MTQVVYVTWLPSLIHYLKLTHGHPGLDSKLLPEEYKSSAPPTEVPVPIIQHNDVLPRQELLRCETSLHYLEGNANQSTLNQFSLSTCKVICDRYIEKKKKQECLEGLSRLYFPVLLAENKQTLI